MLIDCHAWVPVPFAELRGGMTFERALSTEQRAALGEFVQRIAHNTEQARG